MAGRRLTGAAAAVALALFLAAGGPAAAQVGPSPHAGQRSPAREKPAPQPAPPPPASIAEVGAATTALAGWMETFLAASRAGLDRIRALGVILGELERAEPAARGALIASARGESAAARAEVEAGRVALERLRQPDLPAELQGTDPDELTTLARETVALFPDRLRFLDAAGAVLAAFEQGDAAARVAAERRFADAALDMARGEEVMLRAQTAAMPPDDVGRQLAELGALVARGKALTLRALLATERPGEARGLAGVERAAAFRALANDVRTTAERGRRNLARERLAAAIDLPPDAPAEVKRFDAAVNGFMNSVDAFLGYAEPLAQWSEAMADGRGAPAALEGIVRRLSEAEGEVAARMADLGAAIQGLEGAADPPPARR